LFADRVFLCSKGDKIGTATQTVMEEMTKIVRRGGEGMENRIERPFPESYCGV